MESISQAIHTMPGRDHVMALVAFGGMMLAQPLKTVGLQEAGSVIHGLSGLADSYRALTRFSGSIDNVWTTPRLKSLQAAAPGPLKAAEIARFAFDALFYPLEHIAVLAKNHVIADADNRAGRYGGAAVLCWVWSTAISLALAVREVLKEPAAVGDSNSRRDSSDLYRQAALRRIKLTVLKLSCFLALALSLLPENGVQLLSRPGGLLYPLHVLLSRLSPPKLHITDAMRGALGVVATCVDYA